MKKYRSFPSRLPGSDFQFTIRRPNPSGPTKLIKRERFADRKAADRKADEAFLKALWTYFGEESFDRGNLDAGRLSWLYQREVVAAEADFDPKSYSAKLKIDRARALVSFPRIFEDDADFIEDQA